MPERRPCIRELRFFQQTLHLVNDTKTAPIPTIRKIHVPALAVVWVRPASVDGANCPPSPGEGWESGMYPSGLGALEIRYVPRM